MFILVNQLLSHLEECVYARSVGLGLLGYLLSIALFTVLISRKPSHSGKSIPAKPPAFDTQSVGGSPAIFTRQGFHSNHPVAGAALADSHLVYIKHIQTRLYNIVGCRGLFKRSTKKKKKNGRTPREVDRSIFEAPDHPIIRAYMSQELFVERSRRQCQVSHNEHSEFHGNRM